MANIGSQLTNLPNLVTMGRVLFVPGVLYFMDNYSPVRSLIAAILYLVASIGDGIDGYLARSRGQVSVLGKFLDFGRIRITYTNGVRKHLKMVRSPYELMKEINECRAVLEEKK